MKASKRILFFILALVMLSSVTLLPVSGQMSADENITAAEDAGLVEPTAAATGIVSGGVYRIRLKNTNYYLTVNPNSSGNYDANLNNISVDTANGLSNQEFRVVYDSSADIYYIKTIKSTNGNNRLIDVNSTNLSHITENANVHLYAPGDANSSQWQIIYSATVQAYAIKINCKPQYALTRSSSGNAQINTYAGNATQLWTFEPVESTYSLTSGSVYRIKDVNSGLYVSVPGSDANLSNVSLSASNPTSKNQQFRFVYDTANKVYYIKAMMSSDGNNRLLDINSTASQPPVDGRNVHIYTAGDFNSSAWKVVGIGNGRAKIYSNYNNNLVLTAASGGTSAGTNVQVNTYTGEQYQKWVLEPVLSGAYYIINSNSDKCLNVENASVYSGGNIIQYEKHFVKESRWRFEQVGDNQYIIHPKTNISLALDVYNAGSASGTNVHQYTTNYSNAQIWSLVMQPDNTYSLLPACGNNTALDVANSSTANSANVQVNTYTGTDSQKWKLVPVYNFTVESYFDQGCLTRTNKTSEQFISYYSSFIQFAVNRLNTLAKSSISYSTPVQTVSTADVCPSTNGDINSFCVCGKTYATNCTNNRYMLDNFFSYHQGFGSGKVPVIFWTGHFTNELQNNVPVEIREGGFEMSGKIFWLNIGYSDFSTTLDDNRVYYVALHELAHSFDAKDTYCFGNSNGKSGCSNENCYDHYPDKGYEKECVMTMTIADIINKDPSELFCDKCLEDMN